jgi:hypothetical protein
MEFNRLIQKINLYIYTGKYILVSEITLSDVNSRRLSSEWF